MNDMSGVIVPKSDQINADDLLAGPITITIRDVKIKGGQEQPVSIYFDGSDKAFRPCKSMSRVLVYGWGVDAKAYIGRSLTLYCDPSVKWGGVEVGGIRISHMSHIDGAKQMMLTATKGSRKPHKVLPLVIQASSGQALEFSGQLAELKALAQPGNMDALSVKWQEIGAAARKALAAELPALKAACAAVDAEDVPFDAETGEITEPEQPERPDEQSPNVNDTADEPHPAQATADAIIAEINDQATNAVMDVANVLTRHTLDLAAMPEELAAAVNDAADARRVEIRAQQAKAKASEAAE